MQYHLIIITLITVFYITYFPLALMVLMIHLLVNMNIYPRCFTLYQWVANIKLCHQ